MSTKQEDQRRAEQEASGRRSLEALVSESVMHGLGRPAGLHRVQARQVFGGNYRVNVFVGEDAASAKVAHSFFVAADADGKVIESSPAITRRY
jgi:hypothetical protein